MSARPGKPFFVSLVLSLFLLLPGMAGANVGGLSVPAPKPPAVEQPPPSAKLQPARVKRIIRIARNHVQRRVRERRGDNVPRFRMGKGRIAPYSIGDAWCVAFATWVWNRVGLTDYLGTGSSPGALYIRRSFDRTPVAVQVADMSRWARQTGHWSARARRGFLVAYGTAHIGIVTAADRNGRAVWAIEGNQGDGVRKVRVPMRRVTGYISPVELPKAQVMASAVRPDMPSARAATTARVALSVRDESR